MTPEQLEELADCADMGGYIGVELAEAIDAARADLAAMRQPITAEALVKAGWTEDASKFGGGEYTHALNDNERVSVWFANEAPVTAIISMERSFYPKSVATMYQLGQLVELLGVAK